MVVVAGPAQLQVQVMSLMRPMPMSARCWNAPGLKSRSVSKQPVHLSVTVTVTLFPWSEGNESNVSGGWN